MSLPTLWQGGEVATSPDVDALVAANAPVAIGVSGGKDSSAVAFATVDYLNRVGHSGPRVLIHSDLGVAEWRESLPMCRRLAEAVSLELVVVRRERGDMMDRWEQRWADNVARYVDLSCVQLILPWSTPDMRFCTSELKTSVICRALVGRFPGQTILSVIGIRRQESSGRAKAPVAKPQPKLTSKTLGTSRIDWHPIIDWSIGDVLHYLRDRRFPLHEAYTRYGSSRVSCAFCIMSSQGDLRAAAGCADNHDLYRRMVDLEAESTFAFHGDHWLADVAPDLLRPETRGAMDSVKRAAARRRAAESRIPRHLLYTKGWPTCVPTCDEAALLAEVRREVADVVGLSARYLDAPRIVDRYRELMAAKAGKAVAA